MDISPGLIKYCYKVCRVEMQSYTTEEVTRGRGHASRKLATELVWGPDYYRA